MKRATLLTALLLSVPAFSTAADNSQQATAALGKSRADLAAGRYPESIEASQQAAALFHQLGNSANEGLAVTVRGIARLYSGDYPGALRDAEASLALARTAGDQANIVTRLNNIGNVYYFQGRYSAALDRYTEAQHVIESHRGEKWERARRQLTAANLATLYQRLGLYDRALAVYRDLRAQTTGLPPPEQAQMLTNMGALWRRAGDPVKAVETYRDAQALYRKGQLLTGEIGVLNNIGIVQVLENGALPDALATFNESLRLARTSGDRPMILHATLYRAETLLRMGRWSDARNGFETALQDASALEAAEEKWKALYGLARIDAHAGNSADSQRRLREAISVIEALRSEIGSAASTRGYLTDKRLVFDELIAQLTASASPDLTELFRLMEQSRARAIRKQVSTVRTLSETQHTLAAGETLVEFWLDRTGRAAALDITRDRAVLRSISFTSDVAAALARLAASLSRPGDSTWKTDAALLRPRLLPGNARHWILVPDRELSAVPFEALLGPDAEVSYLPSASSKSTHAPGSRPWRWPWSRDYLALADPAPTASPAQTDLRAGASLPRLPEAAAEVEEAAASLGVTAEIHAGADAQRHWLRPAPILHLATHGTASPEDPSRSWLLLASASGSNQRFDYLFLPEVERMELSGVDLVALSACETERGKLQEGEGPRSFSRAFLSAGARTVVSTLWRVEDRTAREYMRSFYTALAEGQSAVSAARSARAAVASLPGRDHPFYWAAFVVTGDADLQVPRYISWTMLTGAAAGLAGLALIAAGKAKQRKSRRQPESPEPGSATSR